MTSPLYQPTDLQQTQVGNETLIKLPSFPNAERPLLDQYVTAFRKILHHAADIMNSPEAMDVK